MAEAAAKSVFKPAAFTSAFGLYMLNMLYGGAGTYLEFALLPCLTSVGKDAK